MAPEWHLGKLRRENGSTLPDSEDPSSRRGPVGHLLGVEQAFGAVVPVVAEPDLPAPLRAVPRPGVRPARVVAAPGEAPRRENGKAPGDSEDPSGECMVVDS